MSLRSRHLIAFMVSCALASSWVATSHAQSAASSAADVAQAKVFFSAGTAAYSKGKYDLAVSQFTEALRLAPRPSVVFALAQSERKLFYAGGRKSQPTLASALAHYDQYLKDAPDGDRREEATSAIQELSAFRDASTPSVQSPSSAASVDTSKASLTVTTNAENAKASIDGGPFNDVPLEARDLTPGRHRVVVRADGYTETSREVQCEGGRRTGLDIQLNEKPGELVISANRNADVFIDGRPYGTIASGPIRIEPGPHTVALSSNGSPLFSQEVTMERGKTTRLEARLVDSTQRSLSYIVMGTGVATLIVSGLLGLGALGAEGDAKDLLGKREASRPGTPEEFTSADLAAYVKAVDQRDQLATASGVTLGVGAAISLIGAGLFVFNKPNMGAAGAPLDREKQREKERQKRPDLEMSAAPWFTPFAGGATVGARF
jgi:hypothetical protein